MVRRETGPETRIPGGHAAGTSCLGGRDPGGTTPPQDPVKAEVKNVSFHYRAVTAVRDVSFPMHENRITTLIGPSGCGKSTLLRCFNRMHDFHPGCRYEGQIILHPDGINLIGPGADPIELRMRIGMVFQKPNPFPKSIFENVAYGLRLRGVPRRGIPDRVENALRRAALWDEVKDRLRASAYDLSGGQQQRLCIARALAGEPEMLFLDEPTSALDPIASGRIEELLRELARTVTVVMVTHNMQQAGRISDYTAFMYLGRLVEFDRTRRIFTHPAERLTEEYISGRFG